MITACLKKKTNNLNAFIAKIKKLSESNVESGYFSEQGQHPRADMSFADLANMHAKGAGDLFPRDVRPATLSIMNGLFKETIKNHFYKNYTLDQTLDSIGLKITDIAQSYFGQTPPLEENSPWWSEQKGGSKPLVHFGDLQDAWSYRTSENLNIRGM